LREEAATIFFYGLALLVVRSRSGRALAAVFAGGLAAGAVMIRIDAAPAVLCLLAGWALALGHGWRRAGLAVLVFCLLLLPLALGFWLKEGDPLAPVGSAMGGDMRQQVGPLIHLQYPASQIIRYFGEGTAGVYGSTIFGACAAAVGRVLGPAAAPVVLGVFVAGGAVLLARGPRLPVVLAVVGAYLPPFTYIAGVQPWTGSYADRVRYVYLVMPAAFAMLAWACGRVARAAWRWADAALPAAAATLRQPRAVASPDPAAPLG
jgi:hypothetical protein